MANYIDFIIAVLKEKTLSKEFKKIIDKSTPEKLVDWFKSKGYTISAEDCKKLIENKNTIKKSAALSHY